MNTIGLLHTDSSHFSLISSPPYTNLSYIPSPSLSSHHSIYTQTSSPTQTSSCHLLTSFRTFTFIPNSELVLLLQYYHKAILPLLILIYPLMLRSSCPSSSYSRCSCLCSFSVMRFEACRVLGPGAKGQTREVDGGQDDKGAAFVQRI